MSKSEKTWQVALGEGGTIIGIGRTMAAAVEDSQERGHTSAAGFREATPSEIKAFLGLGELNVQVGENDAEIRERGYLVISEDAAQDARRYRAARAHAMRIFGPEGAGKLLVGDASDPIPVTETVSIHPDDMRGPAQLFRAARSFAEQHGARLIEDESAPRYDPTEDADSQPIWAGEVTDEIVREPRPAPEGDPGGLSLQPDWTALGGRS